MLAFWNRLKSSRTVWAVVVGLSVIVLRAVFPEFPITDGVIESSLLVLGAYIVAEGLEGFRPSDNIIATLKGSRKFWMAIAGLVVIFAKAFYPEFMFNEDQVFQFIMGMSAVIFGFGVEGSALAGVQSEPRE